MAHLITKLLMEFPQLMVVFLNPLLLLQTRILADEEDVKLITIFFVAIPVIIVGLFIVGAILFGIFVAIGFIIALFRGEIGGGGDHPVKDYGKDSKS